MLRRVRRKREREKRKSLIEREERKSLRVKSLRALSKREMKRLAMEGEREIKSERRRESRRAELSGE